MKKSFKTWLLEQAKRDDVIGDLGRDTERAVGLGWFDQQRTSDEEKAMILVRADGMNVREAVEAAYAEFLETTVKP